LILGPLVERFVRFLVCSPLGLWCSEINRLEELELKLYKDTIEAAQLEKTIVEVSQVQSRGRTFGGDQDRTTQPLCPGFSASCWS
jgi:hypothetical protein